MTIKNGKPSADSVKRLRQAAEQDVKNRGPAVKRGRPPKKSK